MLKLIFQIQGELLMIYQLIKKPYFNTKIFIILFMAIFIGFVSSYSTYLVIFFPSVVFSIILILTKEKYIEILVLMLGYFFLVQNLLVSYLEKHYYSFQYIVRVIENPLILILVLVVLLRRIIRKEQLYFPLLKPVLCLLVIALTSGVINQVPLKIMLSDIFIMIRGYLIYLISSNMYYSESKLIVWFRSLIVLGIISVIYGIVQMFFGKKLLESVGSVVLFREGSIRITSFFYHPVEFAWFMVLVIAILWGFWMTENFKLRYPVLLVVFLSGILMSYTRATMISVLFGTLLVAAILKDKTFIKKILLIMFGVTLLLLTIYPNTVSKMIKSFGKEYGSDTILNHPRTILYLKSFEIAKDYFPFGAGPGRYGGWISRIEYSPIYEEYGMSKIWGFSRDNPKFIVDTFWPKLLGQFGVVGVIGYLWFLLGLYKNTIITIQSQIVNNRLKTYGIITLMILVDAFIESFSKPVWENTLMSYIIFLLCGVIYSIKNSGEKNVETYMFSL